MKVSIIFPFVDGPYGGGNQFLKALRAYLIGRNIFETNPEHADVILYNSHHDIQKIIRLRSKYPNKTFIHRIDGPVFLRRNKKDKITDQLIYSANDYLADGTIFQSEWSKEQNIKLGLKHNKPSTCIINAPDSSIFYKQDTRSPHPPIKIVATSWASNKNKGFDFYKHLDDKLDPVLFEMTFIGNSPYKFSNIKQHPPLSSEELGKALREYDIYLTASDNDPCSNALIEALHSGLPALALNDGGHPEILKQGGELFSRKEEIIPLLEKIANNIEAYQAKITMPTIDEIGSAYYSFFAEVFETKRKSENEAISSIVMNWVYYKYLFQKKFF